MQAAVPTRSPPHLPQRRNLPEGVTFEDLQLADNTQTVEWAVSRGGCNVHLSASTVLPCVPALTLPALNSLL
jgi:hypothetical protein